MALGGKREGAGRKPGSRSRLTLELKATLTETAKQYTADALQTLLEIAGNPKAPPAARAVCANSILDRGWGRPVQALEHFVPGEFERLGTDELVEQLSRQANELGIHMTLTYELGQGDENEPPKLIEGVAGVETT